MIRWLDFFLAFSLVALSNQVAKFVRLPAGYTVTSADNPVATLVVSSLKQCSIHATIQELTSFEVTHYSFDASPDGSCKICTSFDYIGSTNASTPNEQFVWFLKVPENVTYSGSCDIRDTEDLAKRLNITGGNSGLTSASPTTRSTSWTIKRTTPVTTRRTTPKPKPCAATNNKTQARIYLDQSSGMTVTNLPYSKIAVDCFCNNNAKLKQQFWNSVAFRTQYHGPSLRVTCKNKATLCIIPERGGPLMPAGVPPDRVELFPYCEGNHGCHMYAEHKTDRYLGELGGEGWLGAVLVQPGGGRINEFGYYEGTNTYGKRPRGYKSVYIKAVAISCSGCQTVRNYASFTCPMPLAKG